MVEQDASKHSGSVTPQESPILVKLGGSVITHKTGVESARLDRIGGLALELRNYLELPGAAPVVLGHGSGSFGHVAATGTALDPRAGHCRGMRQAIADVQSAARRLHAVLCTEFCRAGVPVISLPPASAMVLEDDNLVGEGAALRRALTEGCVPVVFGDVILRREGGARIASTEEVLLAVVEQLPVVCRKAVWLGNTDGILDRDGKTIAELGTRQQWALAEEVVGGSNATDVTGGMRLRLDTVRRLAALGVESWILDGRRSGVLLGSLSGQSPGGTRVAAEPPAADNP